jgi:hypothetical protein
MWPLGLLSNVWTQHSVISDIYKFQLSLQTNKINRETHAEPLCGKTVGVLGSVKVTTSSHWRRPEADLVFLFYFFAVCISLTPAVVTHVTFYTPISICIYGTYYITLRCLHFCPSVRSFMYVYIYFHFSITHCCVAFGSYFSSDALKELL